ncbi:MAG: acetamidase/formamidase family protein [SAR324 cluster bacterium]|nr:acetamidase/formamidase family protein [SAR324 cluster bacterium]
MRKTLMLVILTAFVFSVGLSTLQAREVRLKKTGVFCDEDPNCHNRWHPAIKPRAYANPGDLIIYETRDALDTGFTMKNTTADMKSLDLGLVHPLTGPVYINGAKRGDVLEVEIIDIQDTGYGYTMIIPGFGFLRDVFPKAFLVRWKTNRLEATSPDMPANVAVKMNGFPGTIGVAPGFPEVKRMVKREADLAAAGGFVLTPSASGAQPTAICGKGAKYEKTCLRTIPPRENGGNMDVKQMVAGTKLLFPCFVDGCLLSIGDVHYAQGDGEVSGTAIEIPSITTVRTRIIKGGMKNLKSVAFKGGDQIKALQPAKFYATIGYPLKSKGNIPAQFKAKYFNAKRLKDLTNLSEDVTLAARHALLQMIDYIVREHGLTREQAYILCSVAVDLHISQLVDVPNVAVTAILDLGVFKEK